MSKDDSGVIGVVIPCRNRHDEFQQAVSSLLQQQVEWVGVVVDDGSIPPLDVPGELSVIRAGNSSGHLQRARNIGYEVLLQIAPDIRHVLFADGDKIWFPSALKRLQDTLVAHPDAGYAYGSYESEKGCWRVTEWSEEKLRKSNYIDSASLIDRHALSKLTGQIWIEDEKRLQDWSLWLRLLSKGVRGVRVIGDEKELLFRTSFPPGCISQRGGHDYEYWCRRIRERYCFCYSSDDTVRTAGA